MVTDLRLVPAALSAWAVAWLLSGSMGGTLAPRLAVFGAATCALLLGGRRFISSARLRAIVTHLALIGAVVAAISASAWQAYAHDALVRSSLISGQSVTAIGRVVSDPAPARFGTGITVQVSVESIEALSVTSPAHGSLEVTVTPNEDGTAPAYGSRISATGTFRAGSSDDEITGRLNATAWEEVRGPPLIVRGTNRLRAALSEVTTGLSTQGRALVPGMAVGDTSKFTPALSAAFKTSGLTHLTAVSGGHFAVVIALLTGLLSRLRAPAWVRAIALGLAAGGFVLLVRPEPSVLRSAAMSAVMLLSLLLGRRSQALASLSGCVLLLLLVDPGLARSFGFALSCSATVGLVTLSRPFTARLAPFLGRALAFSVAVPLAAQVACGPILLLFTEGVPTTSVLANLLVAPVVAPATLLSLAACLLAPGLPLVAEWVARVASWFTWWIAWVAKACADLPLARLPWLPGLAGATLLTALVGGVLWWWLRRPPPAGWPTGVQDLAVRARRNALTKYRFSWRRWQHGSATGADCRRLGFGLAACVSLLVIATALVTRPLLRASGFPVDWQVIDCDVGQGDSLLIRSGPSSAVMIDAGPPGGLAADCLAAAGVERIDLLILSHPHEDHIGGLNEVINRASVEAAWASGVDSMVQTHHPEAGESVTLGDGGWQVQATAITTADPPPAEGDETPADDEDSRANDHSLAVLITASGPGGAASIVALGDLEENGQYEALRALREAGAGRRVDLVKVAHHGSAKQSEDLAQWLEPAVAVFSVGADNDYGHPSERAQELYAQAHQVRTDACGTAVFSRVVGGLTLACQGP